MEAKILNCEIIPDDIETLTEKVEIISKSPQLAENKKPSTEKTTSDEYNTEETPSGKHKKISEKKPNMYVEEHMQNQCDQEEEKSSSSKILVQKIKKTCASNLFHIKNIHKLFKPSKESVLSTEKSPCDDFHFTPEESEDTNGKVVKVNVGDLYIDRKNSVDTKVIEVPFKETSLTINASDLSFELLGDEFGDELLIDKAITLSDQDAKKETRKIRQKLGHLTDEP